jgi:hypothetical protein
VDQDFLIFAIGIIVDSFKVLIALLVLVGDSFVGILSDRQIRPCETMASERH